MPYFFLSRAPGDDDYVRRFYRDLLAEVRCLSGVDHEAGFMDTADDAWPGAVADAVGTCRVFIALCSPNYFLTERCGREWSVFAERLRRHQQATGAAAPALIPVVWANTAGGAPRDIGGQAQPALVPPSPGGVGLRQLIRLHSWRNSYQEFVAGLARRIMDTAEAHTIPPAAPGVDLATAPNAFALPDPDGSASSCIRDHGRWGQRVHFVVAAGTREEMKAVRDDGRYYGATREDWAPYLPTLLGPLTARARAVAAERLFGTEVADLEGLSDRIARADRDNDIVVLLVDAWATRLEAYRDVLVACDRRGATAVGVLVPASREDAETTRHRAELRSDVTAAFPNAAAREDPMFRTEIETVAGFDNDLTAMLEAARNRIYSKGRIFRRPVGAPSADRPILEGP